MAKFYCKVKSLALTLKSRDASLV